MKSEGYSCRQIADVLSTTKNAVHGALDRMRNGDRGRSTRDKKARFMPVVEPVEIPDSDTPLDALRAFWVAVIERQARDAIGDFGGTINPGQGEITKARARAWLESEQLEIACAMADIDADMVFAAVAQRIRAGVKNLGWRCKTTVTA
jgi:hypothetical protein